MKKLLPILIIFCVFAAIFAIKYAPDKPVPAATPKDLRPLQKFADARFADYINSLGAADFEITDASYACRGGDFTRFVCLFEASVTFADGTEENLAYGYFIEANGEGGFVVKREGTDINHKLFTEA